MNGDLGLAIGLNLKEIYIAKKRISGVARRTPLVLSTALSKFTGTKVVLKAENLQITGSFKLRGATNKILSLSEAQRRPGVLAVSTGNHGRAVSYVAREVGIPALVCVSEAVPQNKLQAMRDLGAEILVAGKSYDEAEETAAEIERERGLIMVHPFDDPAVIAGQGTIGVELLEDFPEIDTAIVPLSGGGLISGIAVALKSANADMRIIGVSMERGPAMVESLKAGRPVEVVEEPTLADALAGGIGLENRYSFSLVQALVDDTVLVSEKDIARAMAFALREEHLVLEGGGAVGLAALLYNKVENLGKNVALVISGGNVSADTLTRIIENG
jgi:threonine dehydratase